jgi:hypothetical protein
VKEKNYLILFSDALTSRPVHDEEDTKNAQNGSNNIGDIGLRFIKPPPPDKGHNDEYAAIGRIDPAKVRPLKGGDNSIQDQDQGSQNSYKPTFPISQSLPHQISPANFTKSRKDE